MNTTLITEQQPTKKEIYRYKFSQEFMYQLEIFALEHEEDDIGDFKDAWESWTQDNNQMIANEIVLLLEKNFQGDALEKMFFSARYYYRKKETKKSVGTKSSNEENKKEKKHNIKYSSSRVFLEQMDNHIKSQDVKSKPSHCFNDFVKQYETMIQEEYRAYMNKQDVKKPDQQTEKNDDVALTLTLTLDEKAFQDKIKKTYKNRIFVIRNSKPSQEPKEETNQ